MKVLSMKFLQVDAQKKRISIDERSNQDGQCASHPKFCPMLPAHLLEHDYYSCKVWYF